MCRLSCKSSFCGIYNCLRTGIIFCPNLLAYQWRSKCVGNKFWEELDQAINTILEVRHSARRERRYEEAESPSLTICANQRCLIPKRIFSTIPEVFEPRRSRLRDERGPRGYLWKTLKGTVISAQVNQSRVLLAYYAEGRLDLRQDLRQMLKVQ